MLSSTSNTGRQVPKLIQSLQRLESVDSRLLLSRSITLIYFGEQQCHGQMRFQITFFRPSSRLGYPFKVFWCTRSHFQPQCHLGSISYTLSPTSYWRIQIGIWYRSSCLSILCSTIGDLYPNWSNGLCFGWRSCGCWLLHPCHFPSSSCLSVYPSHNRDSSQCFLLNSVL